MYCFKISALSFIIISLATACNHPPATKDIKDQNTPAAKNLLPDTKKVTAPDTLTGRETIILSQEHPKVIIKGEIERLGHVVYNIHILSGKQLNATVAPAGGKGNIRINQIRLSDGSYDGPFGKTLDYALRDTGGYQVIIGESNMAEGAWEGPFTLTVSVK